MSFRGARREWTLFAVIALGCMLLGTVLGTHVPPVKAAASPMPAHFGIGIPAQPEANGLYGWMPKTKIPWDYAYQYLAGGVNTGSGWETWNDSGQFPLWYAQGAAGVRAIPVFSFYELLQSSGNCNGCGEAEKDLSNLNNKGTMSAYFQNFTLLMKRLSAQTYDTIAGFGGTAIVQIEPDFSGYAEQAVIDNAGACHGFCTGQGNDPSMLKAEVADTGIADLQGLPNTYQGFNWALLHLRDVYAPNVLLAFHVSNWATRYDVGSDPNTALDAVALGTEAGSFAAQSGITGVPSGRSYDLLFNDVLDRDAGYYAHVYHNPSVWWDRRNVKVPNFKRWETYLHAASVAAGRKFIIWQIPLGNQYFDTENNTDGHYQDNRAEYFFGHIAELAKAGIIGLLFGAGNGGSTLNYDGKGDGITNPSSFCTHEGTSGKAICNNHRSSVADDDGGYIRMQARTYYAKGGYTLPSSHP